jgi:hypothetical protein
MQRGERLFDLIDCRRLELPVRLVADAIDAQPARPQILDDPDHAGALGRLLEVVVVVIELGVRVCLVRELEGLRDVVVADTVMPRRLARRAVLVDGLVHDVPAVDLALVATDDGVNVVADAGEERLPIGGLAVRALEDPDRRLPVPHEGVADDLHLAIAAEPHVAVLCLEGVMICHRMHVLELEQVLRGDLVELLRDDLDSGRIDEVALALVDCDADHYTVRHQIF